MPSPPRTPELIPWTTLQTRLAGSFEAHARGFLRTSYTLTDRSRHPFGELRTQDNGAILTAGDLEARLEPASRSGYRMLCEETELARATPLEESAATLQIECAGKEYEARLRLLSNTTVVRLRDGGTFARISGSLAGRRYESAFDVGVVGALPVVILLLHYMTALRRRIYLAG